MAVVGRAQGGIQDQKQHGSTRRELSTKNADLDTKQSGENVQADLGLVTKDIRKTVNVFYHTFSGPTEDNKQLTRSIVAEQMSHIVEASKQNNGFQWIVRYRSVGEANVVDPSFMVDKCKSDTNLRCDYQGHLQGGHEETTLQQMLDFCRENTDETVVYIHSKGSLHDIDLNRKWRAPLTVAAMKPSCIEALQDSGENGSCNTCGLQFYPLWAPMYPGNMFSAKCSYVQNLLPLSEFGLKITDVVNMTSNEPEIWKHGLYERYYDEGHKVDIAGLGRYSNEQWIASHPSVRQCDLSGEISRLYPMAYVVRKEPLRLLQEATASPAPRVPLQAGKWFRFRKSVLAEALETDGARPHEYYLLSRILYRFYRAYGSFPPENSWIWDYYPNGGVWKEKVAQAHSKSKKAFNESLIW
eukprot:CAMPEP_0198139280 /NCGR_PEP_ID=MMETSP1443-20131203/2622_1 /TAXON_ID=186043 /ORGANISM="Entomoneis sp., Strain CCMP2396" /LENGTH=411 /DNA_ID=CAMNT_0043801369 /DNA_START=140 /DNA_END=1372 /DNA_ORIENTATION=-